MILLNRDLSWLSFNLRVLQEAHDPSVPLFERLKYLSIFSSNLNEFFRVRYPEVMALSILNKKTKKAIENFEENNLDLIFQNKKKDGEVSTFHKFVKRT